MEPTEEEEEKTEGPSWSLQVIKLKLKSGEESMYMAPFQIDCPLELHNGNMLSSCDSKVGKTLVLEGHVKGLLCIPLYKLEWIFFSVVFGPSLFKHAKNLPRFVICGLCPINLPWMLHF